MVQFKCFTFLLDKSFYGHFQAKLSTSMSVYSVTKLILRELGSSATNITVSTGNALGSYETMDEDKRLEDYGFAGALDNETLPEHTLFYDFDYPLMNCPIMSADFWKNSVLTRYFLVEGVPSHVSTSSRLKVFARLNENSVEWHELLSCRLHWNILQKHFTSWENKYRNTTLEKKENSPKYDRTRDPMRGALFEH